jgi:predicted lipid carrier protein YhbT
MQVYSRYTQSHPLFPAPLSLPLRVIPSFVHNKVLVTTLNRIFYRDLKDGEPGFLQGKLVHISIVEIGVEYRFTLNHDKLIRGT